jgi:hypothetical protein
VEHAGASGAQHTESLRYVPLGHQGLLGIERLERGVLGETTDGGV